MQHFFCPMFFDFHRWNRLVMLCNFMTRSLNFNFCIFKHTSVLIKYSLNISLPFSFVLKTKAIQVFFFPVSVEKLMLTSVFPI